MYFEDGADWCSTCTSSSDDSDYERWDKDDEGSKNKAAIEERLSRSRPNPSSTSKSSRHLTRSSSSAIQTKSSSSRRPKFNRSATTGPTIIFYDDRPSFTRPDWLLDPISFNPDSPCHAPPRDKKLKKKHKKKCAVQWKKLIKKIIYLFLSTNQKVFLFNPWVVDCQIFEKKLRFLTKISIFDENFDFWRKFRFLTKISMFG